MSTSSRNKYLDGDPDPEDMDGDAEEIQTALYMTNTSIPDYYNRKMDLLESKEIGKKKLTRKGLDWTILMTIGFLCRNYKLGYLDSDQIEKFETAMIEFSLILERLKKNNVKIPHFITEQLEVMGLVDKK